MKNNLICELCGYQAKTPQGLAGHRQFKHQLAQKYARARELAGKGTELAQSVELLERKKTELENSIAKMEKEKAELENKVDKLTRISDNLKETIAKLEGVKVPELAQRFRTELMALGWCPIGEMDTGTLLALGGLRWIFKKR
jgi:predicted nuclease with TOPRIM domain